MARKYRKKGRSAKAKPSVLSMIPIGVLAADGYSGFQARGFQGAVGNVVGELTGWNPEQRNFNAGRLVPFYGTVVAVYLGKKVVNMSGVNRAMKGLPFRL